MISEQRAASAEHGTLVSLWGLLGLSLFKGAAGWLTGSKALLADACQSAADCAGFIASFKGMRRAHEDPARARQAGVGISIVLSALLLVAGLEMAIASVRAAVAGPDQAPGWGAIAAIAAGIALREMLARYKRRKDSQLGIRPDRSGDNRSDLIVSVVALAGTSAAKAGDMMAMPLLYVLDPAAGFVISVFVLRTGYRLTSRLLRRSEACTLDEVDAQTLLEVVQRIDGVVAVDDIRAREQGHYIVVETLIRVNPRISVAEGQDIALRVRRQLTKRFLHVADASVQVQPYDPGYPYKSNHQDEDLSALLQ